MIAVRAVIPSTEPANREMQVSAKQISHYSAGKRWPSLVAFSRKPDFFSGAELQVSPLECRLLVHREKLAPVC